MMKFKSLGRESARTLKQGGRLSVVVEASTGSFGVIDFPFEVAAMMKEFGLTEVGKVYLPRRGDAAKVRARTSTEGMKAMSSDCRELLTFEKR
ncbi:MAG: hypothetical protein HW407_1269 [Bacteroidetes bacterium]|nr:hypothetical protein [Bacteroidota bacterium]